MQIPIFGSSKASNSLRNIVGEIEDVYFARSISRFYHEATTSIKLALEIKNARFKLTVLTLLHDSFSKKLVDKIGEQKDLRQKAWSHLKCVVHTEFKKVISETRELNKKQIKESKQIARKKSCK